MPAVNCYSKSKYVQQQNKIIITDDSPPSNRIVPLHTPTLAKTKRMTTQHFDQKKKSPDQNNNKEQNKQKHKKAKLENNIQVALQSGQVYLEDAIDIREVRNIKLANQLLKVRRKKK